MRIVEPACVNVGRVVHRNQQFAADERSQYVRRMLAHAAGRLRTNNLDTSSSTRGTMTRPIIRVLSCAALLAAPSYLSAQNPENGPSSLPLKHMPEPTSPAISAGDLMTRLYVFADDSMMGRETGTRGHLM